MTTKLALHDVLKIQRERLRAGEGAGYRMIGRVVWLGLELQLDHEPTPVERLVGGRLDWQNSGPMLAMSLDQQDLLFPDGMAKLPQIPDPTWTPPELKRFDDGSTEADRRDWVAPQPPLLHQSWQERAVGRFMASGETWLVFQPVTQICYRPLGIPTYGFVTCQPSAWTNTTMALIVNENTMQAHLYGGRFVLGVVK